MINIGDAALGFYPVDSHRLKFQICHGTGCILRQSLIDPNPDLSPFFQFTVDNMLFEDFFSNCITHSKNPFLLRIFIFKNLL